VGMFLKRILLAILCIMFIAACGSQSIDEPITLSNQEGKDVTFPATKPVLVFFMTTYT
jgi:ABC-type Fe3+-hydroxamate transport system substrate-binding protein